MSEFLKYLLDVLHSFGNISLRRMFAGYGFFCDGIMFGLVCDDVLYLKADAKNIVDFQRQGLEQFKYSRQGKLIGLSYYRAPDSVLEDPGDAVRWARRSYEVALCDDSKRSRRAMQNVSN
ncbi:hypothetical protein D9M70_581080 [compost metagenome]